jgi:hypothetical protein
LEERALRFGIFALLRRELLALLSQQETECDDEFAVGADGLFAASGELREGGVDERDEGGGDRVGERRTRAQRVATVPKHVSVHLHGGLGYAG